MEDRSRTEKSANSSLDRSDRRREATVKNAITTSIRKNCFVTAPTSDIERRSSTGDVNRNKTGSSTTLVGDEHHLASKFHTGSTHEFDFWNENHTI